MKFFPLSIICIIVLYRNIISKNGHHSKIKAYNRVRISTKIIYICAYQYVNTFCKSLFSTRLTTVFFLKILIKLSTILLFAKVVMSLVSDSVAESVSVGKPKIVFFYCWAVPISVIRIVHNNAREWERNNKTKLIMTAFLR
jgi:hypothetical protein